MKRKVFVVLFLLGLCGVVAAASLNLGARVNLDFGQMRSGEKKTIGFPVWGYYFDAEYHEVFVEHIIEGGIAGWLKVRPKKHWVLALPGSIPPYPEANVFVTLRVPKDTLPGDYNASVFNKTCMPKSGMVGLCSCVVSRVTVEVV